MLDLALADGEQPRPFFDVAEGPASDRGVARPSIDDMIERLAQEQEERRASHRTRGERCSRSYFVN